MIGAGTDVTFQAALIAAIGTVVVALISFVGMVFQHHKTRNKVGEQIQTNTTDHAMVVEALDRVNGNVSEMRDMLWSHITDSRVHNHPGWALSRPVSIVIPPATTGVKVTVDGPQIDAEGPIRPV